MIEISKQSHIQQKSVAAILGITPQAISAYVKELLSEGLIGSDDSSLQVTKKGVGLAYQYLREMRNYLEEPTKSFISHHYRSLCGMRFA